MREYGAFYFQSHQHDKALTAILALMPDVMGRESLEDLCYIHIEDFVDKSDKALSNFVSALSGKIAVGGREVLFLIRDEVMNNTKDMNDRLWKIKSIIDDAFTSNLPAKPLAQNGCYSCPQCEDNLPTYLCPTCGLRIETKANLPAKKGDTNEV